MNKYVTMRYSHIYRTQSCTVFVCTLTIRPFVHLQLRYYGTLPNIQEAKFDLIGFLPPAQLQRRSDVSYRLSRSQAQLPSWRNLTYTHQQQLDVKK